MYLDKRMDARDAVGYIVFQFIGAIIGAAILWFVLSQTGAGVTGLGTNGYGEASASDITLAGALVVEVVMTFIFVLAALGVTSTKATSAQAGLVIGLTLVLVHLMAIGLTGTSVNPARSFGPALMMLAEGSTLAIEQVWVFIVAPVIGAIIAALVWKALKPADESILDERGKLDYNRLKPVLFEFPTYQYLRTGSVIGQCTEAGKQYEKSQA